MSETLSIDDVALLLGEGERRRQEPGPEAQKDEAIHAVIAGVDDMYRPAPLLEVAAGAGQGNGLPYPVRC